VFPEEDLSKLCSECEVGWVKLLGMGLVTYKGSYSLAYVCAFVEDVLHPSFSMQHFSKPFSI
jgi:hypothetical protein